MDRRDTLRLEKELLDKQIEHCQETIKLVYPVFLASGGYVFAHLEVCVLSRLYWKVRAMQRKWDEKNF